MAKYIWLLEICESSGKHLKEVESYVKERFERHEVAHFDNQQPQNVSAIVGKTAFLTCVVKNLLPTQKVVYTITAVKRSLITIFWRCHLWDIGMFIYWLQENKPLPQIKGLLLDITQRMNGSCL